ncbi:hypothetical protein HY994_02150 [Candidatus Micrarchaeota archaeon]|nr:hypothetical protein [Candidatus Micrarchaeota archaeon]
MAVFRKKNSHFIGLDPAWYFGQFAGKEITTGFIDAINPKKTGEVRKAQCYHCHQIFDTTDIHAVVTFELKRYDQDSGKDFMEDLSESVEFCSGCSPKLKKEVISKHSES